MKTPWNERGEVPARIVLVLLGFWGCFLIHAQRVNLSVAIVAMVDNSFKDPNVTGQCAIKLAPKEISSREDQEDGDHHPPQFAWSHQTQALVLSAYYYGYVSTQIPGGRLAEIVGSKWLYAMGILGSSVLALLTPLAASLHPGFIVALRVAQGMLSGASFPLLHILLARWIPAIERSFLSTLAYGGLSVGNVGGLLLTGIICQAEFLGGWPLAFYLIGSAGILWSIAWVYYVYDSPIVHPRISAGELEHILSNQPNHGIIQPKSVPWRYILTSVPVWALLAAHMGHSWGTDTLLLELPTYMHVVMGIDIGQIGAISALPFLMQALCACVVAYVVDRLLQKGTIKVGVARKTCNSVAFFGAAACLLCVPSVGCHTSVAILFLCMAMGFDGVSRAGFFVNHMDLAPEFAGTLMGLTNTVGSIDGFLVPSVVSLLTEGQPNLYHWTGVFVVAAAIYLVTGVLFLCFGSGETLPWGSSYQATVPLLSAEQPKKCYEMGIIDPDLKLQELKTKEHGTVDTDSKLQETKADQQDDEDVEREEEDFDKTQLK